MASHIITHSIQFSLKLGLKTKVYTLKILPKDPVDINKLNVYKYSV